MLAALLILSTPDAAADSLESLDEVTLGPATVQVGVFGNVDIEAYDSEDEQVFSVGLATLDVFLASRAWDKVHALADVVFEEDANAFQLIVDRYLVRYDWRQFLQVGVGQDHNPLIHWNRRVSHGFYLQTPIGRPKFLDREVDQGIWPNHLVGITANGEIPGSGVGYLVTLANGRGPELTQLQIREDANRSKAVAANLHFLPFADGRLRFDVSAYVDRIPAQPEPLRERDYSASVQFEDPTWEARGEVALMELEGARSGRRSRVWGGYALVGMKWNTEIGEIRPYLMATTLAIDDAFAALPYFAPAELEDDESSYIGGVRWEPVSGIALKLEYSQTIGEETAHDAGMQFAFAY